MEIVIESIEKDFSKKIRKSDCVIWAHYGCTSLPILFIKKPKHLTDSDFKEIISKLQLTR